MTTHPIIDRLAGISSEELTVDDVRTVLARSRKTIERHLRAGDIESVEAATHGAKGQPENAGKRNRYSIPAAAVLTFLVKTTGGDKAVLLDAIRVRFPHHHALCLRIANGHACSTAAAPLPSNVIQMAEAKPSRAARKPIAPKEHPDQLCLFDFQATA